MLLLSNLNPGNVFHSQFCFRHDILQIREGGHKFLNFAKELHHLNPVFHGFCNNSEELEDYLNRSCTSFQFFASRILEDADLFFLD